MGQKVHPYGFRVGYIYDWKSRWFANKYDFPKLLVEDIKLKKHIKNALSSAAVSKVEVERASEKIRVLIFTARPGIIIGRRGSEIEKLKEELQAITGKEVIIDIKEIRNPNADAQLVAENIALQLEKRIPHRRAMKKAVQNALDSGAQGVKIICGGRLGGAEIARRESYRVGSIPAQTLRADIDYGFTEALTKYGLIGIKVWIYKGDRILDKHVEEAQEEKRV
ncbi:MAG: 30S ribosomal protein S3 [Omnitrophica bacterium RIFCSPLOWO2_02_FULL_45_16]|nr:MAG: 30S ribosomal protein S3 [Omnitrophica bacterium RIFCSPHIGHO2_02_FULL_46_20]OGW92554.1 MAG: 30S ribosomal protein S3 [Omnitrophica bacterium RIFCSPLOWO2_12_FULL_45_13]OGW93168.1 MAG: 30S ribosomal protein S3 [Omnitrophica bacterium RIFCSPLOWO2_01_FULL_45_24]OGX00135.1 MAG: 30S ribosomal protein S3 [Omnitrophica bacterium RIFCSPLOWO2_02_FULL_45_16]